MLVKIHWIIDGVAEFEVESQEEAEKQANEILGKIVADNPVFVEKLGARSIQGTAYLPGSEDEIDAPAT
jgi:hypothetical protein